MNGKPEVYAPLADALLRLHEWLVAREADVAQGVIRIQKQNRFEKEEVVWQGPQVGRVAVAGGYGYCGWGPDICCFRGG